MCSGKTSRFSRRRGDVKEMAVGAKIHSFLLKHCSDEVRHHKLNRSSSTVFFKLFFLAYHCHNTKHVLLPIGTANINACFHDTSLLACLAGGQVSSLQNCQPATQQRCGKLKFRSCNFSNLTRLDDYRVCINIRTMKQ